MTEQFLRYKNEFVADLVILRISAGIALLLIIGGAACIYFPLSMASRVDWEMDFFQEKDLSWVTLGIALLFGVGLWGYASFILYQCYQNFPYRFRVGHELLIVRTRQGERTIPWNEIEQFRETHEYFKVRIKGIPSFASTAFFGENVAKTYRICLKDDQYYDFDDSIIKGGAVLSGLLKARASQHEIPWEIIETQS